MSERNIKMLLADDDFEDRFIVGDAFKEIGFLDEVQFVESGEEVFSYLESITDTATLPRLIVLDMNMPRMNGREILAALKSNERYKKIKVMIFSTSINENEKRQCIALGATGYVTKPVKYEDALRIARQFREYSAAD